jgi:hypothetical protein
MTELFKSALDILADSNQKQAEKKLLHEELFELQLELKRIMDRGLTKEEIEPLKGLKAACEAAEMVVAGLGDI